MMKLSVASSILFALVSSVVIAGDPAITELSKVDAAYHFVGEYMGQWQGKPAAVQVSTRKGDTPFYAKLFQGGLPGIGWDGAAPQLFQGDVAGSQLRLTGANGSMQMEVLRKA